MPQHLKNMLLDVPDNFPTAAFDAIAEMTHDTWVGRKRALKEFAGSRNAIVYRFLACAEHGEGFRSSLEAHGATPPPRLRYEQEQHLFGFFVNGFAAVESFYYSLYVIAHAVDPVAFPLESFENQKGVTPDGTTRRFERRFAADPLTATLREVLNDPAYASWKGMRNVLAHRTSPGRAFSTTMGRAEGWSATYPNVDFAATSENIPVEDGLTSARLEWLGVSLGRLMSGCEAFVSSNKHLLVGRTEGG